MQLQAFQHIHDHAHVCVHLISLIPIPHHSQVGSGNETNALISILLHKES